MDMPPTCPIGPITMFTQIQDLTKPTLAIDLDIVSGDSPSFLVNSLAPEKVDDLVRIIFGFRG